MNPLDPPFLFTGTLDGPELDLVELSGLSLSHAEITRLWGRTNGNDLLRECTSVRVLKEEEFDGTPGQSDRFFEYEASSMRTLGDELKVAIKAVLSVGPQSRENGLPPGARTHAEAMAKAAFESMLLPMESCLDELTPEVQKSIVAARLERANPGIGVAEGTAIPSQRISDLKFEI